MPILCSFMCTDGRRESKSSAVIQETKIVLMTQKIVIGTWTQCQGASEAAGNEVCFHGSG